MSNTNFPLIIAAVALFAAGSGIGAAETDDRIEASFRKTYVYRVYLKDDAVKAAAKDGVVTLTGTVEEDAHRVLAQETAASLPGVTRVDNRLATRSEATTGGADTWIASKIRIALLFHRNVDARRTAVTVRDGVVTLSGESSSMAQKELTAEYAKDIEGVSEVRNDLKVVAVAATDTRSAGEQLDDASIAGQVRTALLTHRSTGALKLQVGVRDGTVTLTGVAGNAAEKSLAGKLVGDTQGVTGVENLITVVANPGR